MAKIIDKRIAIKKGNTSNIEIPIYDKDGVLVPNLAAATDIVFQVKKREKQAVADIEKTKGAGIVVDSPDAGWLTITLIPTDSSGLDVGRYYCGLEITWSASNKYEVRIYADKKETEAFHIEQDIVS